MPSPQRVVIDTNTWVSGLVWHGAPRTLVRMAADGRFRALTSEPLIAEFARVLQYPRIVKALTLRGLHGASLAGQLRLLCDVAVAAPLRDPVARDPDDDAVLACAISGNADLIVSGDSDLLVLHKHAGIPIVSASQAVAALTPA